MNFSRNNGSNKKLFINNQTNYVLKTKDIQKRRKIQENYIGHEF